MTDRPCAGEIIWVEEAIGLGEGFFAFIVNINDDGVCTLNALTEVVYENGQRYAPSDGWTCSPIKWSREQSQERLV